MKKITAIFVCLLLVVSLAVAAFAATPIEMTLATANASITRGATVELTVTIPEVADLRSGSAALDFDTDILEFVGGSCTQDDAMLADVNYNNNIANGVFTYKKGNQPASISGLLFTFNLKVKDTAAFGKTTVKISNGTLKDGAGATLDVALGSVELEVVCDHKWDDGKVTTAATCEADGVKTYTCEVSGCGETKTEAVAKLGHKMDAGKVTTAATCEADGVKTFTCENGCGKTQTEAVAKLGHKWDAGKVTTAATCEADGVKTFTCENGCGKTQTEAVAKLGHKMDAGKVTTAPTCAAEGVKTFTCENGCGKTETEAVAKIAHTWGEGVVTTAPTCTAEGVKTYTCSVCADTKTEAVAKIAHTLGEYTETKAPTCAAEGEKSATCSVCTTTVTEPVAKLAHTWDDGKVTTAATTKAEGVKTYTCTVCGETKTESIPKLQSPATDDNSMIIAFVLLMVLSATGVAVTVIGKKRVAR